MNKTELVEFMADQAGISKKDAQASLEAFVDGVTRTLKKGGQVTLVGFGSFDVQSRKARTGRNPQTGEEIKIKASKAPRFRPSKALKGQINK